MADMYFETLKPRIEEEWKKKGRKPEHIVKAKIAKEEVIEGIEIAKKEREKYIKKHPQETLSYREELQNLKKSLEEKKAKGKDTSSLEIKIKAIEDKLKTSKEKLSDKDVAGIKEEIEKIKKEGEKI
jgi:predicted RNase H-like nuclease (RuvC/YqgF family)